MPHLDRRTLLGCLAAAPVLGAGRASAALPPDGAAIKSAAEAFMAASGAPGLAIGIVAPTGERLFRFGLAAKETRAPIAADTLFEIGSLSKTFLIALAALAAEDGALHFDDPVTRHVPELRGSRLDGVTLLNLATHTTGGMPLQVPDAVKTRVELMAWYRAWVPPAAPGTVRTYSNLSIGLLGLATAKAMGGDYATLMQARIFAPLGLADTMLNVPAQAQARYAQGYTRDGRPIRLAGGQLATEAYAVRTTAGDMVRFIKAQMGLVAVAAPLRRALDATHTGYFRAGPMTQALVWEWYPAPVAPAALAAGNADDMALSPHPVTTLVPPQPLPLGGLLNKTGATNGFGGYVLLVPGRSFGLVILANRNHATAERLTFAEKVVAAVDPGVLS